jgi:signal transduction histidine kinase
MRRPHFLPRSAALVALLLLGALPSAAQTSGDPRFPVSPPVASEEHALTIEGADMAVFEQLNTTRTTLGRECDGQGNFQLIHPSADGVAFTFDEFTNSSLNNPFTGCEAIFFNVTLPAPATVLRIAFTADRLVQEEVTNPCGGLPLCLAPPLSMVQELQLDFPDGTRRIDPYFPPGAPSQPPTRIQREFLLPQGTSNLTLSWFFQDEGVLGPQADVDTGRARLTSTVSDLRVQFDGIVLPPPLDGAAASESIDEENGTGRLLHSVNLTAPAGSVGDRRSSSLTLEIRRGPSSTGIVGPRGPVPEDRFNASRIGDRVRYTVDTQTVAEQGEGDYTFQFATVRTLPPPPPPGDPTRVYAFFYVLAALPAVAAVLAVYQAVLFVRQAEGPYRRAARPVLVAVLLVVVYYLLVVAYAAFVLGVRHMSTLPLSREAILVYAQLVLLLLILAAAALAVSRRVIRAMQRDLEERARQQDQLRRSNEELERFAYVASHDLQEPLRKVAGFTALLQKKYGGRLDKDADEIIGYAVDGATRMQMLIKDILAYSRVGSKELNRVPVDLESVMQLVVSDLGPLIAERGARVTWDELPTVRADASQLRQVLQNLVENAIKYAHPRRKPVIAIAAAEEADGWHFHVKDNGIGIPADKHEEIFGLFRRLQNQGASGTGIGLAVAKKAVERHGGRIWVESTVGSGSTFHFTLPQGQLDRALRWSARGADAEGGRAAPA